MSFMMLITGPRRPLGRNGDDHVPIYCLRIALANNRHPLRETHSFSRAVNLVHYADLRRNAFFGVRRALLLRRSAIQHRGSAETRKDPGRLGKKSSNAPRRET